ncbi:epoxide hydrolase [Siphonobacter sp. BAB-5385]|uniref:epoxide hydrolase family protein n=1 Tax=Siphonobacter sp. BAB-5385 TaxID=1864822 RepID=UPI000B9DF5E9|nr:epoxide hydrolase family protein [Siphonobacter sp. BAB-5385]OZI09699.1 epoxide hydrolase [Siphonobacter sp. BAB-5385]
MHLQPYRIEIPEEDLQDLKRRLVHTRLPTPLQNASWTEGTDPTYLRNLLNYWADGYDWRQREQWFNSFPHYRAEVDGVTLHFIHAKAASPNAVPLLLMQGWPSSFVQVLDFIPLLTHPARADALHFDVIAVSLPGYAFSELPTEHGMNFARVADLVVKLMVEVLGYERFAARGSDQGALVQQQIGLKYPERLIGLHRSGITPFLNPLPGDLTEEEKTYQQQVAIWAQRETAYARLQAQRPETLLPALTDSPAGLASWILEKFQRWGDTEDLDQHFGRDKLLDTITLHWFAQGGAGSIRLYHEAARDPGLSGRVQVPTAIAMPLRDGITVPAPRRWAERFYDVQQWTVMERGGHFPEWEIPEALAEDIRSFFSHLLSQ